MHARFRSRILYTLCEKLSPSAGYSSPLAVFDSIFIYRDCVLHVLQNQLKNVFWMDFVHNEYAVHLAIRSDRVSTIPIFDLLEKLNFGTEWSFHIQIRSVVKKTGRWHPNPLRVRSMRRRKGLASKEVRVKMYFHSFGECFDACSVSWCGSISTPWLPCQYELVGWYLRLIYGWWWCWLGW